MAGLLNDILDPIIGGGSEQSDAEMQRQLEAYKQLVLGNRPELLQQGAQYTPETYGFNEAQYQTISEDPAVKAQQLAALGEIKNLADTGLSDADRFAMSQARQQADQQAASQAAAIRDSMSRRGLGGGGQELAMSLSSGQAAANRAAQAMGEQQALAAQQKAAYRQAYLQGLGQQRSQDYQTQAANANIINQFNAANTQGRNQYQADIAGLKNQAGLMNYQMPYQLQQQNIQNTGNWLGQAGEAYGGSAKGYAAKSAAEQANRNAWLDMIAKGGSAALAKK